MSCKSLRMIDTPLLKPITIDLATMVSTLHLPDNEMFQSQITQSYRPKAKHYCIMDFLNRKLSQKLNAH